MVARRSGDGDHRKGETVAVGLRSRARAIAPAFLKEGVGERLVYVWGLAMDALLSKLSQGMQAHMPTRTTEADALAEIGKDRLIPRGQTESATSYGTRLQKAFDTWRHAGSAQSILGQARGLLLDFTPRVRLVSSQYALDPARLAAQLLKTRGLKITAATNATPIAVTTVSAHGWTTGTVVRIVGALGNTAANGQWTITVTSTTSFTLNTSVGNGSYTGGGRVIRVSDIPSVSYPPARLSSRWDTYDETRSTDAEPVQTFVTASGGNWDWDSASQVTDSWRSGDGYLIIYAVDQAWCTQPIWMIGDFYSIDTVPGSIGLSVDASVVQAIRAAAGLFKNAGVAIRWIIVSFDNDFFDPSEAAGGDNPNGDFGTWSKITGGAYVPRRFEDAEYCDGIT